MPPSSRSTYQPRKHSKTFTGCWTCRARKVKCDEARPECSQCLRKGLRCQGYGVRLHWMTPETGAGVRNPESPPELHRVKSQRSQIAFEPQATPLQCYQVDEILNTIDALGTPQRIQASLLAASEGTLFIHQFGVINLSQPSTNNSTLSLPHDSASTEASPSGETTDTESPTRDEQHGIPVSSADHGVFPLSDILDPFSPSQFLGSGDILNPDLSSPFPAPEQLPATLYDDSQPIYGDGQTLGRQGRDAETLVPHNHWQRSTSVVLRCPSPVHLSSQEQFLMYHYTHRVVRLFCVIDNAKSPWKTIHLPRALQSAGELNVMGSSSRIRSALRNALLSVSAFYLSNDAKSRAHEGDAAKWANEATLLRGRTIRLLKEAVENNFYCEARPKYKEFLATMLSMITINVMSGDTATCGVHLDGALRLMSHARNWKSKYSSKAQALHRIYFYLRTIYESTAVRAPDDASRLAHQSSESSVTNPLILADSACPIDDTPVVAASSKAPDSVTRMVTYECIYGVPQSLLVLLNRAVELINQVNEAREREGNTAIPAQLTALCDGLERDIMDWPTELGLKAWFPNNMRTSSDIIHHTTRAFHNAVIIYFAQHIRLLGYRYLQPYVQVVLESIEAIERIKAEMQILAAPLYWPAFIAATEAFDERLQDGFKKWYDQVEGYGIAAVRTGIKVLTEVWREKPGNGSRITSVWRMVVKRSGATLMLS